MATTVVEMSQPNLAKQPAEELPREPEPVQLNQPAAVNQGKEEKGEKGSDSSNQNNEKDPKDSKNKKGENPKPKIFDNKTFVEAPLPKINPWTKSNAAPSSKPSSTPAPAPAPAPAPEKVPEPKIGKF